VDEAGVMRGCEAGRTPSASSTATLRSCGMRRRARAVRSACAKASTLECRSHGSRASAFMIGRDRGRERAAGRYELLDGSLDELAVFARPLRADEVALLATIQQEPEPVLQMKFDSATATTTPDSSRFAQSGTIHGIGTIVPGIHDGALALDGDGGDYVSIPYSAQLSNLHTFSVAAWVKLNVPGRSETILSTRHPAEAGFDFKIFQNTVYAIIGDGSDWVATGVVAGAADVGSNGEGGDLPAKIWQHVACVVDSTARTISLYLNGDLKKTVTYPVGKLPLLLSPRSILTLGSSNDGRYENFGGALDDVLVFNRALSSADVAAIANTNSQTPPSQPSAPSGSVVMNDLQPSSYFGAPVPDAANAALVAAIRSWDGDLNPIEPFLWSFSLPGGAGLYAVPTGTSDPVAFLALWSPQRGAHVVPPGILDVWLSQNGVVRDPKPWGLDVLERAVKYWGYPSTSPEAHAPGTSKYELDNPNVPVVIGRCQKFIPESLPPDLYPPNPYLELVPRDICFYSSSEPMKYGNAGVGEWPHRRCAALYDMYLSSGQSEAFCVTEDGRLSGWLGGSPAGIPAACISFMYDGPALGPVDSTMATCDPAVQSTIVGLVTPKFMVTRVVYAPPGSEKNTRFRRLPESKHRHVQGCCKEHHVNRHWRYVQRGARIKASVKAGGGCCSVMMTGEFGNSSETTNTSSMEAVSQSSLNHAFPGPCKNGIDHNFDVFDIVVKPELTMVVHPKDNCSLCSTQEESVEATFGDNGVPARVLVGELRNFIPEESTKGDTLVPSAWLTNLFADAGIGATEVKEIHGPGATPTHLQIKRRYLLTLSLTSDI
jgi:hypothetical protein